MVIVALILGIIGGVLGLAIALGLDVTPEFLDHVLIWNAVDLGRKLEEFRVYYNEHRVHQSLNGRTPGERSGQPPPAHAVLDHYAWRHHCRGLFHMPVAA
jgi:putative transposase